VKNFFRQSFFLLRQIALPVFILTLFSGTAEQLLSLSLENELRNPEGTSPKIWLLVSVSILSSLTWPWLMSLIVLFKMRPVVVENSDPTSHPSPTSNSWFLFFHHYGAQSLIETLRSWGQCLLYSLLLILPGLWKFLEYTFVSWVVCFDPRYEKGEVDALKTSSQFFRQRWFTIVVIMLIFAIVLPLIITSLFEDYRLIWMTPGPALALHFVDTLIHLIYFQIITLIYFRLLAKEQTRESYI